jgi:hypothetical protein
MSRSPLRLLVLLAAAFTAIALAVPAQAAAPYCGITWGSLPKQAGNSDPSLPGSELAAVRAGQHACYDRLVLDVTGSARVASYRVAYVSAVRSDGSGAVVPLKGGAFLQISLGVNNAAAPPSQMGDVANVTDFPSSPPPPPPPAASRGTPARAWACGHGCRSASSPCPGPAPPRGS